jgi:hypothetical protein
MSYQLFEAFHKDLPKRFPKYKLVSKDSSLAMKILYYGSLMFLWNRAFMTNFTTVLGYTVYMPPSHIGGYEGYKILRHESIHMEQYSRLGIWFYVLYTLVLPAVWTYRAKFEFDGYVESLRVEYETTGNISEYTIDWMVGIFASPSYLWMCPFKKKMKAKFLAAKAEIIAKGNPIV